MKILGDKVRQYRRRKGLSQKELANGICTQATISLIEKKNKIPSMQIMMKLCNRLNIRLEDVIVENDDQLYRYFKKIDQFLKDNDLAGAAKVMDQIKIKQLQSNNDKKQYYYYFGYLQLKQHQNPDEAIFNFGLLLNQFVKSTHDMYAILATMGTGLAYAQKQSFDKAEIFVKQAVATLADVDASGSQPDDEYLQNEIMVYTAAAQFYAKMNLHGEALKLIEAALKRSRQSQSLYLLDRLYAMRAANQYVLNEVQEAHENYYVAYSLSLVNHNQQLTDRLVDEMTKNNITPLQIAN